MHGVPGVQIHGYGMVAQMPEESFELGCANLAYSAFTRKVPLLPLEEHFYVEGMAHGKNQIA